MQFRVHYKERLYFAIMAVISAILYGACTGMLLLATKTPEALTLFMFVIGVLTILRSFGILCFMGYLRGHAIRVSQQQFPDLFEELVSHSKKLALPRPPIMYILQGNGLLNAFALRFFQHNYVVLYSDIADIAYHEGNAAVSFIIGHELGHIKRGHTSALKSIFLLPAKMIPFLGNAYSRACEYTCDNIGYALCPQGALQGILLLAAGKQLYRKVDVNALVETSEHEPWLARTLFEILSTHPQLIKRVAALQALTTPTK